MKKACIYPSIISFLFMVFCLGQKEGTNQESILFFEILDESVPSWYPDDSKIVFASINHLGNSQLYTITFKTKVIEPIGAPEYTAKYPSCSSNSKMLYYLSDKSGIPEIHSLSLDGKDERQITFDGIKKKFPVISPNGKEIAFIRYPIKNKTTSELCVLNLRSGVVTVLHEDPLGYLGWPSWDSNGNYIYSYKLFNNSRNNILRADRQAQNSEFLFTTEKGDTWNAQATPDGEGIYYLYNPTVKGEWGNNSEIRYRKNKSQEDNLVFNGPRYENGLAISHDGSKIAFSSDITGYYQLHILDTESRNVEQLTFQTEMELCTIIRKQGMVAGRKHYDTYKYQGKLFSEKAISYLIQDMERNLTNSDKAYLSRLIKE